MSNVGTGALRFVRRYYPDVNKVEDAKRGTIITVTQRDCDSGVGKAANLCAIAKAAERRWDGAIVSLSRAYLIRGRTAYRYQVPDHVEKELIVFDRSHSFSPGKYQLDKVHAGNLLGRTTRIPKKPGRKTNQYKKNRKHYTEGVRSLTKHAS
jgi:hypothetical protein